MAPSTNPEPMLEEEVNPSSQQPLSQTISSSPIPTAKPRRQSSLRFSDDTSTKSKSPMSTRRRPNSSEETDRLTDANQDSSAGYGTSQPTPANVKTSPATNDEDVEEAKLSWYKRVLDKYGSVQLENKSSVARDHLALERTFLAWLRTSLSFASIGVAITQLFRLNVTYQPRTRQEISISANPTEPQLPYSPMIGYSIPPELIPQLQQALAQLVSSASEAPKLGPTLLDQLLLLPSHPYNSQTHSQRSIGTRDINEDAATRLRHVGKPLGATFLAISIVVLLMGFHRYFQSQYWLVRGKFPASRGSIFVISFITAGIIIASLVIVLVITPTSYKR